MNEETLVRTRYLTDEEKKATLKLLDEELYPNANPNPDEGLDSQMMPYLKALNEIGGAASFQSCAGHCARGEMDNVIYYNDATLHIRLSERMAKKFYEYVFILSSVEGISRIYTLYSGRGEEIVKIIFDSVETDRGKYLASRIVEFFESMVTYVRHDIAEESLRK